MIATNGIALGNKLLKTIEKDTRSVWPKLRPDEMAFIDSATLSTQRELLRWLIDGVLVAGQPGVVGGFAKTAKSTICVDLAISLGSGTPFLGRFDVRQAVPVAVLSAESGRAAITSIAERVCHSRKIALPAVDAHWAFWSLPLTAERLERLADRIRSLGIQVVIIDPTYRYLAGRQDGGSPADLFRMGEQLAMVSDACLSVGTAAVFVHHFNRRAISNDRRRFEPPELSDLTQAGMPEFARQWILLSRRAPFDQECGEHQLWMNVGSSVGFSSLFAVNIREGQMDHDFKGRIWQVSVHTREEVDRQESAERRQAARCARNTRLEADCQVVREALLKCPNGETKTWLHEAVGVSKTRIAAALTLLEARVQIERVEVPKGGGNAKSRNYPGYRLTESGKTTVVADD